MGGVLRIAIVTPEISAGSGGISTYALNIACGFSRLHELILVFPGSENSLRNEIRGIVGILADEITYVPTANLNRGNPVTRTFFHQIGLFTAVRSVQRLEDPDIFHFTAPHGSGIGWMIAHDSPSIVTVHSPIAHDIASLSSLSPTEGPQRGTDKVKKMSASILTHHEECVLSRADGIVSVSNHIKSELSEKYPHVPIYVVENGVNTEMFRPRIKNYSQSSRCIRRVLFVSRMMPSKGIGIALESCRILAKEGRADFQYVFVGQGENRRYQDLAIRMGIEGFCTFAGSFDYSAMPEIYRSADIFCSPSFQESYPMSILEAMSTAMPCIATNVGSVGKMIEHRRTGLVVEPGDATELAHSIGVLLDSPDYSNKIGHEARKAAVSLHSVEKMCGELVEIFSRHTGA